MLMITLTGLKLSRSAINNRDEDWTDRAVKELLEGCTFCRTKQQRKFDIFFQIAQFLGIMELQYMYRNYFFFVFRGKI